MKCRVSKDPTVRVCLSIKESTDKKVRDYQVRQIMKYGVNYSYSKAVQDILEEKLKK